MEAHGIKPITVQDVRDLRTELRENLPANPTPLEKKAYSELEQHLTNTYESRLVEAGATPEQIGRIRGLDQEYGDFRQTMRALDPRSERFGEQVSDALFNPMLTEPAFAAKFIDLAQAAEKARPGEVVPQLREAFLTRLVDRARVGTSGPVEEMKIVGDLQTKWGGNKGTQLVLNELFGRTSPFSDPATLARVLQATDAPEALAGRALKNVNMFRPPEWLVRIGAAYGMYAMMTGSTTSPWNDMHKDPAKFFTGMVGLYVGMTIAGRVISSGSQGLQKAYVDLLLHPDSNSLRRFGELTGASAGAITSLPKPAPTESSK